MAIQIQPARIAITDSVFKQSYQDGVSWVLYGDRSALRDTIIVEFVRDNILSEAFEPPLSPETVTRSNEGRILCSDRRPSQQGLSRCKL